MTWSRRQSIGYGHISTDQPRSASALEIFWAGVIAARDLAAVDVIEQEFTDLAQGTGLIADLGPSGKMDAAHLIRWALIDQNPFC